MKKILILIILVVFGFTLHSCKNTTHLPLSIGNTGMGYMFKGITEKSFLEYIEAEYGDNGNTGKNYVSPENTHIKVTVNSKLSSSPVSVYAYKDMVYNLIRFDYTVYVFVNKELYTWGTFDDLKKHPESEVREIMKSLTKQLKEEYSVK